MPIANIWSARYTLQRGQMSHICDISPLRVNLIRNQIHPFNINKSVDNTSSHVGLYLINSNLTLGTMALLLSYCKYSCLEVLQQLLVYLLFTNGINWYIFDIFSCCQIDLRLSFTHIGEAYCWNQIVCLSDV